MVDYYSRKNITMDKLPSIFNNLPAEIIRMIVLPLHPVSKYAFDIALKRDIRDVSNEKLEQAEWEQYNYFEEEKKFWDTIGEQDDDFFAEEEKIFHDFEDENCYYDYSDYDVGSDYCK